MGVNHPMGVMQREEEQQAVLRGYLQMVPTARLVPAMLHAFGTSLEGQARLFQDVIDHPHLQLYRVEESYRARSIKGLVSGESMG
jgi:hypothetical protein